MVDLHSHLLPGVDDGSRSVEQSVTVLRKMARRGVTELCLTPHFEASRIGRGIPVAHDEAWERLKPAIPEGIKLHRGVELMLDRPFPVEGAGQAELRLGKSRYLLVEFPNSIAPPAALNALSQVAQCGLVPLLAHPERYTCCTPEVVARWKAAGARMQLDARTLFQPRTRGDRARALLAAGLGDILAGDNHGDSRLLPDAFLALSELGGHEQADLLARGNPTAILAGDDLTPVPPFTIKQPLLVRLRQLLNPEE